MNTKEWFFVSDVNLFFTLTIFFHVLLLVMVFSKIWLFFFLSAMFILRSFSMNTIRNTFYFYPYVSHYARNHNLFSSFLIFFRVFHGFTRTQMIFEHKTKFTRLSRLKLKYNSVLLRRLRKRF